MMTMAGSPSRFKVYDSVAVLFGPQLVKGRVVEDRGLLGMGGRRIYRVELDMGDGDVIATEVPETDIEEISTLDAQGEAGPRQEYHVRYSRKSVDGPWSRNVSKGRRYPVVKAKGAIGYSSAGWGDEPVTQGIVTVFLDHDLTADQATQEKESIRLADARFKREFPDAVFDAEV